MSFPYPENFMVGSFIFELRFLQQTEFDSYPGHLFRSVIGKALHDMHCYKSNVDCADCALNSRCVYAILHEAPFSHDIELNFGMSKTNYPKPFMMTPLIKEPFLVRKEEMLTIDVVMVGQSSGFINEVIRAFVMAGRNGIGKKRDKFELISVKNGVSEKTLFLQGDFLEREVDLVAFSGSFEQGLCDVMFDFYTPVRLLKDKKVLNNITFCDIWKNVVKRASVFCSLYGGSIQNSDMIVESIEISKKVKSIESSLYFVKHERYSASQKKSLPLSGMAGRVVFSGVDRGFLPLLNAGAFLRLGKGATSGLGKYDLFVKI